MARTHGKILCTIWHDDDFRRLSVEAQRLYLAVLSQSKLNLVGLLDYFPGRFAALAPTTSKDDIEATMAELEAHRFVIVDRETNELLIRSFTRNDPIQVANSKLRKGLWSAWQTIDSQRLRQVAVWEMPDALFDHPEVPPAASHIRTSERTEAAYEPASDSPPDERITEPAIEPPTDSPPPPPPPPPPPAASAARPDAPRPVDNRGPIPGHTPDPSRAPIPGTPDPVELTDEDHATARAALDAMRARQHAHAQEHRSA